VASRSQATLFGCGVHRQRMLPLGVEKWHGTVALFGALHAGAPLMQAVTGTPVDMVEVLQAVIVLFVAAPPLIRAMYRLRDTRAGGVGGVMSKGWNA